MGMKGYLNDFECDMAVGVRQAALSISETLEMVYDLLGFSQRIV